MLDAEILLANCMVKIRFRELAIKLGMSDEYLSDPCQIDLWRSMGEAERLRKRHRAAEFKLLSKLEGTQYLIDRLIGNTALMVEDPEPLVRRILQAKRLERLRGLSSALLDSVDSIRVGADDFDFLMDKVTGGHAEALKIASNISEIGGANGATGATLAQGFEEFVDEVFGQRQMGKRLGISSGIDAVDECLGGGFRPHEFFLIGGRTGIGKTHFGIHAAYCAWEAGNRVLFFSGEMTKNQILARLCARHTGVDSRAIREGKLKASDFDAVRAFAKKLAASDDFLIFDDFRRSMGRVEAIVDLEARIKPVGMVVVDYAQILETETRHKDALQRLQEISSRLKALTVKHPVALLVLAQLNREAGENAPEITHVRGNDSFAHDCDGAILLHSTDDSRIDDRGWLRLRKMRHGEQRDIFVNMDLKRSNYSAASVVDWKPPLKVGKGVRHAARH
jgi:replicative DNA helicase